MSQASQKIFKNSLWREFLLGWRLVGQYIIRGRRWTLVLTIFLMAVAFVNLVFVSSLLGGVNKSIESQVKNLMVGEVYLEPKKSGDYLQNAGMLVNKLRTVNGVEHVSSLLSVYGELSSGEKRVQTTVKVIDPKEYPRAIAIDNYTIDGKFLPDDNTIFVGEQVVATGSNKQLAESLEGTKVGDTVTLKINGKEVAVKVGGVFRSKYMYADREIYMTRGAWSKLVAEVTDELARNEATVRSQSQLPMQVTQFLPSYVAEELSGSLVAQSESILRQQRAAAALFPSAGAANLVVVRTQSADEAAVKAAIARAGFSGVEVRNWRESAGYMNSIAGSFAVIDAIMLVVGVFIAAVTIFIVIYVDVINKRRQIGIQRAIGVKPRIIVFSYVLMSVFYAVCGIVVGLVVFFAGLVPYFTAHPFSLPIADVTLDISLPQLLLRIQIIMMVAIVSGILPSIMASRMKMLDAILGRS
ncbi:MAG: FtsX-like permease family protein [Candidatus Saccharibacteria bacterium]|nr:FtsX-like permease family protein [Candidatus Saccharibacteria bacterium]